MSQSLEKVKDRLRRSYLGKGGVHAVGLSRARQAIRVYVSSEAPPEQSDVLDQLRESAKPFPVIVVLEDRPRLT
jgi:hypothetical protein